MKYFNTGTGWRDFDTKEGAAFRKNHPLAHNICVFLFFVFFIGGIMGAVYIGVSKLDAGRKSAEQNNSAQDARLYAISYGQMAIESSLRDADSVKYQLKAYNLDNDSLCYSYSALNGFGGRSHAVAVIRDGKSFTSGKAFAQYCANGSNFERY